MDGIEDLIRAIQDIKSAETPEQIDAAIKEAVTVARSEFRSLEATIGYKEDEIDELQKQVDENNNEHADAIHEFLDCVERPTGKLHYTVSQRPATDRAILKLFDAIDRNP